MQWPIGRHSGSSHCPLFGRSRWSLRGLPAAVLLFVTFFRRLIFYENALNGHVCSLDDIAENLRESEFLGIVDVRRGFVLN